MKLGSFGKYKTYIQQIKYLLTCDNFWKNCFNFWYIYDQMIYAVFYDIEYSINKYIFKDHLYSTLRTCEH